VAAAVRLVVFASRAPWWVVLGVIGGIVLLLRPVGARLGRPAAEAQERRARAAAAQYLQPGETIEAVVCGVAGWFGMTARSLVLTDRRVLVLARDSLVGAYPRDHVRTVSFKAGSQAAYELVLEQPDGNRFFLQVVPAFRTQAETVADALGAWTI
jgi:hypothetical protein